MQNLGTIEQGISALVGGHGCLFFAYETEAPFELTAVSEGVARLAGYEPDALVGVPITNFVVAEDWVRTRESAHNGTFVGEVRIRKLDGSTVWLRTNSRIARIDGRPMFIGLGVDIDSLKRREMDLANRLVVDQLTGLLGRDAFIERLVNELDSGFPLIAAVLDLDGFRQVNESLGHPAGDEVLRAIGERLGFLVNGRLCVARFGADEFGILLTGEWDEDDVQALAKRLREIAAEPVDVNGIEVQLTGSVGLSYSVHGITSAEIMRQAEVAMQDAKRTRSEFTIYCDSADDSQTRRDLAVIARLRRSLEQELELHYQPIIDLWTGETVAVEGLARWSHPDRGLLYPGDFLPAIEIGGLAERLDLWAIESASRLGHMRTHSGEPIRISVNVTAEGLKSLRIVPRIRRLRQQGVVTAGQLVLEISERNVQDDLRTVRPVLEALRELGVGIALDDFGTGYSSLTRLRDLPFTEVKLDRSFVSMMNESDTDRQIVHAAIALGSALGLTVIAEGVETKAIADGAGALGCSFAQGRFYSDPMPLSDLLTQGLIVRAPQAA